MAALSQQRGPDKDSTVGVREEVICWDVVEVTPNCDHSLFMRFKDGLQGVVQLSRDQFTGVLEGLRDERLFERVSSISTQSLGRAGPIWRRILRA
jgi:hypothetical protein